MLFIKVCEQFPQISIPYNTDGIIPLKDMVDNVDFGISFIWNSLQTLTLNAFDIFLTVNDPY